MKKLLIVLLLLSSCKAKHTTTTITKTDTIYRSEVLKVTPKTLNEIFIEDVCDSLGQLKIFEVSTNTGKTKTTLRSDGNAITATINTDSIVDVRVNEYITSHETKDKTEVITKRYIPKWVWYSLALNLLLLTWIFRKRIFPTLNIFR